MRRVAASVLSLMAASKGFAFCPNPEPEVCAAFFVNDVVFVGNVLAETRGDEDIRFRVQVSKVLRGHVGKTVFVYTGNDSARLDWEVGETHVVFAQLRNGRLESDCWSGPDSESVADMVREIQILPHATGAVIEGDVLDKDGQGLAGTLIRVTGDGATYSAKTDAKGQFRIQVPPGRYRMPFDRVHMVQSDYNLQTDLENIVLVNGQCAQVRLLTREQR